MKPEKKILALIFIISTIGLLTESLAAFDIERTNIFSDIIFWTNYISPSIDLSFSNQIFFDTTLKKFNSESGTFLNYLNVIFYAVLFLSGIIYWLSKGKETKVARLCFAIFLLQTALLIVFIIPVNLTYYEYIKSDPYLWPRTIYFMINRAVWFYLIYRAVQSLTTDQELKASRDNKSDLLHLTDTPKIQRFIHLLIDSILCLMICSVVFNSLITEKGLAAMRSVIGWRGTIYIIFFLCTLTYYLFYEVLLGFTPAKILTGSRVITLHGEKISFRTGFLRTLSRKVPFEGLAFLLGPNCPHDYWTDTRVIKEKQTGVKGLVGLWVFSIVFIGIAAIYVGNKLREQNLEEDIHRENVELNRMIIENELAHLDTTVVFQLEDINGAYAYQDSTNFLKVESIRGDSVELSVFKYIKDRTTYEIQREYELSEVAFPKITVHKSLLKKIYKSGYDTLSAAPLLKNGQEYYIEKIRRFFVAGIKHVPDSDFYSEAYGITVALNNDGGASAMITALENVQGNLKWENSLPIVVNTIDLTGNLKLNATNFKMKEKYKTMMIVEEATGRKQKYMIEIHNSTTYFYRIFE